MKLRTGHTLLELMVAMAIFGLILSAIFNIFVPGVRTFMVGKEGLQHRQM
jgi:prepilin-type N-terminal cleavage/methylation domain-containing protein